MKKTFFLLILVSFNVLGQKFLNKLENKTNYENLSGLPLVEKYGEVLALKLVYDLKTKKIYYINSKNFKYHYEFCNYKLENNTELKSFNKINYSNTLKRRYLLANINYYKSLEIYSLEISPIDLMSKNNIISLWSTVVKSTYIGNDLKLMLNSTRLQKLNSSIKNDLPTLNPSYIYKNLNYQAISKYKSCGTLHFINNLKYEKDKIKPTDIIVLKETPLVLPKVKGIIINQFQTPLSHLSILGRNRKIPIYAHKLVFKDSAIIKLNSKKVCLEVLSNSFKIKLTNKIKVPKHNKKKVKLKYNLKVDSLIDIRYLNKKSFKYTGHKASNFGALFKLSNKYNFKVPEAAFVIPFYFYNQHVKKSKAKELINNLLAQKSIPKNKDSLKTILKSIRNEIRAKPLDSLFLKSINHKIRSNSGWTRMRFRSSTNAEDANGFSGAGLYTSKTGIIDDKKKSFEKAITKVWASLWSYKAFSEREYYNINHNNVYMAILVHRSFPNEEVNGVAITKNLYRSGNYGFVVNAQLYNESVVKPKQGIVSDQFICYPNIIDNIYSKKTTIDIITQSSLNNNKLTMTEIEIQNLANKLDLIKKYFFNNTLTYKSYLNFGLDIEFKLEQKNRDLYIKQVRLYND